MKLFIITYFWRIGFILIGLSLTISNYLTLIENQKLDETIKPVSVKIVEKGSLRATWIDVEFNHKIYYQIEIPNRNDWRNLKDSISLIYNERKDQFYVPNTSYMNKRFLLGSIFFLVLSVIPWHKIRMMMKKKNIR